MLIALHKNARTTPAVRAEIAASNETASTSWARFGPLKRTWIWLTPSGRRQTRNNRWIDPGNSSYNSTLWRFSSVG